MHIRTSQSFIYLIILLVSLKGNIAFSQCSSAISSFPYLEDFEGGPANWFSGGLNDDWLLGNPVKPTINAAANGNQAWISGGLTIPFYNYGERSWVQSPCFDFSTLSYPVLSFKIFWELENQYDGGNVQYSIDGGLTWRTIGSHNEPNNCINQNWYNTNRVTNLSSFTNPSAGWSGTIQSTNGSCRGGNGSGTWLDAQHCISELAGEPEVYFRFTMGSGTTCNDYDGIAFDYIQIFQSSAIPFALSYTCLGNNEIQFHEDLSSCHDAWQWNFGDFLSSVNLSIDPSPIHKFSGPGAFTVELISESSCIPSSTATINIEILNVITESTPVTCDNGSDGTANVLIQNPPPSTSYTWNTIPVQQTSTIVNLEAGNYSVTISAPGLCDIIQDVEVDYGPDAYPKVSLGPDTVLCPGNPILIYPGSFTNYEWQNGSVDSVYAAYEGGFVSLRIENVAGCTAYDTLLIEEDCLGDILFPNSFSPNSDGLNEVFNTVGNLISTYELNIFNRWGQVVFTSNDPKNGWDGAQNGINQQEGIYIYKAVYSIRKGETREKVGRLTLLR